MKKYAIIILVAAHLTLSFTFLHAEGESSFVYRSNGKRNPFVPLVDKDGKFMITHGDVVSIRDIVLEGIMYDPRGGESVVILNDFILKENDHERFLYTIEFYPEEDETAGLY